MTMYFADDKDVLDLLETSKRRLTAEILRDFLLRRGILVSPDTPKDGLFEQISMWTLDWEEVRWLLDKTAPADRSERYTSTVASGSFSNEEIRNALDALKESSVAAQLDSIATTQTRTGTVSVAVTYAELDPAKTRLRQKRIRDGALSLDISETGVTLRHEANERMAGIADEVIKALATVKGAEVKPRRIELSHLASPDARTRFFLTILDSMEGLNTQDVSKVQVERTALQGGSKANLDESDGDEEEETRNEQIEIVANQVRGAMLRGESLISSPEFQMLKKDFYLCGLEWTSQESGERGRMIQFEAAFDDPAACTGFRYKVKGVIERKKTGEGIEFVKTARACTDTENVAFVKLLEGASRRALDVVEASVTENQSSIGAESAAEEDGP